jgi:serine phosphatase RsbU (regulator of sigma subunit)
MSTEKIRSRAFQRAALQSESRRTVGLLCLVGVLILFVIARDLAAREFGLLVAHVVLLAFITAYEAVMLVIVKRALQHDREVPPAIWILNVCIETQLPTIALIVLIETRFVSPEDALVAPVVLLYFLVITLSTLRLSPTLSMLTGFASAIGYLSVALFVESRLPGATRASTTFPRPSYVIYAAVILAGGIVAAAVAGQIRNHVLAALREVELKRELDRVNHDLDIARSIQQGLLPSKAPNLEDFDVAGWNQPADQTGGDYFDWQSLPDGRLAISLGDATGHGIGPALVMASCRAYARASFLADGKQDSLLDRLTALLAEDLLANQFVTFAVIFLDPTSGHVQVLSAGHGTILWYRYETDKIQGLEAQGIPLGMIGGIKYDHGTEGRLGSGDSLVLVTDGFYEWENPEGEEFGLARLEAVIREGRDCQPEEVISRLRSAVTTFSRGTTQKDDLTAVILKRRASPLGMEQAIDAVFANVNEPAGALA